MTKTLERKLTSIDVSDPRLYQDDTWRPLFAQLRRDESGALLRGLCVRSLLVGDAL